MKKYKIIYKDYSGVKRQITATAIEDCEEVIWFTYHGTSHYLISDNVIKIQEVE